MIKKHINLSNLCNDLVRHPAGSLLAGSPARHQQQIIYPVASIAHWIVWRHPELLERDSLNILILGAESMFDAQNNGYWYHLLPAFTASKTNLVVDLLGANLMATPPLSLPPIDPDTFTAQIHAKTTLNEYLAGEHNQPDLVVMMQPGLESHPEWFDGDGLANFVNNGTPIMISAYEEDEQAMDCLFFETWGFRLNDPGVKINPFRMTLLEEMGMPEGMGIPNHFLWELAGSAITPTRVSDQVMHNKVWQLSNYTSGLMFEAGITRPLDVIFNAIEVHGQDGESVDMITLPQNMLYCPSRDSILTAGNDEFLQETPRDELEMLYPKALMDELPIETASAYEKYTWLLEWVNNLMVLSQSGRLEEYLGSLK